MPVKCTLRCGVVAARVVAPALLAALALLAFAPFPGIAAEPPAPQPSADANRSGVREMSTASLRKSTPVLVVDRIEPALEFWRRVGVEKVVDVPEGEGADARLGFAILAGHGIEVMYQTATSVAADLVASASERGAFASGPQQGYLFVEVASIEAIGRALEGERLLMPFRTTAYGAKELVYSDRAGNVVVFAEMSAG